MTSSVLTPLRPLRFATATATGRLVAAVAGREATRLLTPLEKSTTTMAPPDTSERYRKQAGGSWDEE